MNGLGGVAGEPADSTTATQGGTARIHNQRI